MALSEEKTYFIQWVDLHPNSKKLWRLEIFFRVDSLSTSRDCTAVELPKGFILNCELEGGYDKRPIGMTKANAMSLELDIKLLNNSSPEGNSHWVELKRRIQKGQNITTHPFGLAPCYTLFSTTNLSGADGWSVEFQGVQRGRPSSEFNITNAGELNANYSFKIDVICIFKFCAEQVINTLISSGFTLENYPAYIKRYDVVFDYFLNEIGAQFNGKDEVYSVAKLSNATDSDNYYQINELSNLAFFIHFLRLEIEGIYRLYTSDKGGLIEGCAIGGTLQFESLKSDLNGIPYTYNAITHPLLIGTTFKTATPFDYFKFYEQNPNVTSTNSVSYQILKDNFASIDLLYFISRSGVIDGGVMKTNKGILNIEYDDNGTSISRDGLNNAYDMLSTFSESCATTKVKYRTSKDLSLVFLPIYASELTPIKSIDITQILQNNLSIKINGSSISDAKILLNGGNGSDIVEHHFKRHGGELEEDSSSRLTFHNMPDSPDDESQMKQSYTIHFPSIVVTEGFYGNIDDDGRDESTEYIDETHFKKDVLTGCIKLFWFVFWDIYHGTNFIGLTNNSLNLWKLYYMRALPHISWGQYNCDDGTLGEVSVPYAVENRSCMIRPHSQFKFYTPNYYGADVNGFADFPSVNDSKIYTYDIVSPPLDADPSVKVWRDLEFGQILFEQRQMCSPSQLAKIIHNQFNNTTEFNFELSSQNISLNDIGEIFNFTNGGSPLTLANLINDDYLGDINLSKLRLIKVKINANTGNATGVFQTFK